jgi:hypothetical protein
MALVHIPIFDSSPKRLRTGVRFGPDTTLDRLPLLANCDSLDHESGSLDSLRVASAAGLSTEDSAIDRVHALAHKYLGSHYPWLQAGERRVTFTIEPTRVRYEAPRG